MLRRRDRLEIISETNNNNSMPFTLLALATTHELIIQGEVGIIESDSAPSCCAQAGAIIHT